MSQPITFVITYVLEELSAMTSPLFAFGQIRPEFQVPVLNERAVRAAAGILFFVAMVTFMNAWLLGNFAPTRVFVVAFLIDFAIRLFINPRFAPSLVLGQWFVRRQQPEWTGAPQKRFAWALGFLLALIMLFTIVIGGVVGPINMLICSTCLLLMFFESAFGICLGCWIYNRIRPGFAQLCPGGVCELPPDASLRPGLAQWLVVGAFAAVVIAVAPRVAGDASPRHMGPVSAQGDAAPAAPLDPADAERCRVPAFAKAIGHEQQWKAHNGCPP